METGTGVRGVLGRIVAVLIPCWCIVPIVVVFAALVWGTIVCTWPGKLLFIVAALGQIAIFTRLGLRWCRECRELPSDTT